MIPEGTELSPRPPWVPAWDSLDADEQALAARFMECFAAFLSHADAQIGRVLAFLEELGELDDTLVIAVSDNGASSEGGAHGSINDVRLWNQHPAGVKEMVARIDELGGPTMHNNYPWGWTMAGNTPLRRWKRETHEGGIADPCIVHWPSRLGARRRPAPSVRARDRHRANHPRARRRRASRADRGRRAAATRGQEHRGVAHGSRGAHAHDPVLRDARVTRDPRRRLEGRHVQADGAHVLRGRRSRRAVRGRRVGAVPRGRGLLGVPRPRRAEHPAKLAELKDKWWAEADKYHVAPLDNRAFVAIMEPAPSGIPARDRYVFRPGGGRVPEEVAPDVKGRSHRIIAEVDIPAGGAEGVLLAQGSILGGYSLFVADGRLQYVHNYLGRSEDHLAARTPFPKALHARLRVRK